MLIVPLYINDRQIKEVRIQRKDLVKKEPYLQNKTGISPRYVYDCAIYDLEKGVVEDRFITYHYVSDGAMTLTYKVMRRFFERNIRSKDWYKFKKGGQG